MISLARENVTPRLGRNTMYYIRLVLAGAWLCDGIGVKIFHSQLAPRYESLGAMSGLGADVISIVLGSIEILLALWLCTGWTPRWQVFFQIIFMIFLLWMDYTGLSSFFGHLVSFGPRVALLMMIWGYGPGSYVWSKKRHRATWTRG